MTDKLQKTKLDQKLASLIHYIIWKCQDNPSKLGATKLNKILWHSDTTAFRDLGEPITTTEYKKLQNGPVPEFQFLKTAEEFLENKNDIVSYNNELDCGYIQKQFIAKTKPDISGFKPEQISIIDEIIYRITAQTAKIASDETHQNFWWDSLKLGDEIPHRSVFAKKAEITLDDVIWAEAQKQ